MNEFHFLKAIITSNFKRLNFPFKLSYAVTYRCNLRCKMCNIWKKKCGDELSLGDIARFFKSSNLFSWIGITGGEPFLREDLADIVDIILTNCKRLYAIHLATNATLPHNIKKVISAVRKKDKKIKVFFTISMDAGPSLHNEIRGADGVWETAAEVFRYLKESADNISPSIGFTLSEHNLGRFKQMYTALQRVYPPLTSDDISVYIFQKSAHYYDNTGMPDIDEKIFEKEIRAVLSIMNGPLSYNNLLKKTYLKLYNRYIRTKKSPVACKALSSTCFLDPYGNIYPCSVYDKRLLNIKGLDSALGEVWGSPEAKALSYECSNGICPSCWSPCEAYSAIGGSLLQSVISSATTGLLK